MVAIKMSCRAVLLSATLAALIALPALASMARADWVVGTQDGTPVVSIEGAPKIEGYHEYYYFRFSSDVPESDFYCSLDDQPFAPCESGAYRYVPYGQHTLRVYAAGPGGTRGDDAETGYESRDPNWD